MQQITFQVKSWFSRQLRKHATSGGGGASGAESGDIRGQGVDEELDEEEENALLQNYQISMYEDNLNSASS